MPTVWCTTDYIVRLETSVRDGKVVAVFFQLGKHTHTRIGYFIEILHFKRARRIYLGVLLGKKNVSCGQVLTKSS